MKRWNKWAEYWLEDGQLSPGVEYRKVVWAALGAGLAAVLLGLVSWFY